MPGAGTGLASKFKALARVLDERSPRLVAGCRCRVHGIWRSDGSRSCQRSVAGTVIRGIAELKVAPKATRGQRIRRQGADRKRTVDQDAGLKRDLESLVEPVTRGDPESSWRWTCRSVRQLAAELKRMNHQTRHRMVAKLLHETGYEYDMYTEDASGGAG